MRVIQDVHDYNGELLPPALSPDHVWNGEEWLLDEQLKARNLAARLQALCVDVDREADNTRLLLSGDTLRALEHQRADESARAFLDAGAPAEAVPQAVAAWVTEQRDARQAAEDIVAHADRFAEALLTIRSLRLQAKEKIRSATGAAQADAVREQVVQALRQLLVVELE